VLFHVTEGQSQQDRLNDLYTLIAFSLVLELPSNNYGKSPLIIFTLPESAIAEIGRRSEETYAHRRKARISAKLAAPREAGKPALYAMASPPALKAIRSLAGPGKLSSFVNVNGRETLALLTLF
jgi:hypothetical protein